ncbi:MAG: GntR family transcriptional regulator [Clostridia bacterium]|nr:GntR family transcriptional regulator [Clostridia bacterium]
MFQYQINPDSDVPIYRQLVDQINAQIRSGALRTGTQLPTVREMAQKLHLSCGTIKHVYDRLQEMGDIEMTRRRGTFVKYVRRDRDSRKQQAMTAIDQMIRKLSELNFSPAEIEIFLNLKMREWGLKWSGIRICMVTEYTELTAALEMQLSQLANVQATVYPLRQLREYPYSVDEQSDVILASSEDCQLLMPVLPDHSKLMRVAFFVEPSSIAALAGLVGRKVGVICEEEHFVRLVQRYLPEDAKADLRILRGEKEAFDDLDALIIPAGYEERLSADMQQKIADFRQNRPVCPFACRLDGGSMLYLEERISKLREERQLWPMR